MLRTDLLGLSVCLLDNSAVMKSRRRATVSGRRRQRFKQFAASILPMSPYRQRNWLESADQGGDSRWRGGGAEGKAE